MLTLTLLYQFTQDLLSGTQTKHNLHICLITSQRFFFFFGGGHIRFLSIRARVLPLRGIRVKSFNKATLGPACCCAIPSKASINCLIKVRLTECVCVDKCHCLPSVVLMLLNNVKSFNETMIYLSPLLRFRESRMDPISWDHSTRQWIIIYHEAGRMHVVNGQTALVYALLDSALFKAMTSWDKMLPGSDLIRQSSQFLFPVHTIWQRQEGEKRRGIILL